MEDTQSLWNAISKHESYPVLENNIEVDVAIIGGGITGITTALQLIKAGKKIAILEADLIGGVTTGLSTGNLYVPVQPYYQTIISKFDLGTAKSIADSRQFAIDFIEKTIHEKNIKCNFMRRPWYLYTEDDRKLSMLEKEIDAFKKMDFNIQEVTSLPFNFKFKKAALLENQARFNPCQYVRSIASDLKKMKVELFEKTRVISLQEKTECILETATGHRVTAKKVVIATHTPIGVNTVQFFIAPYRSYVVGVKLQNSSYAEGHFWDLSDPHHAVCTHAMTDSNQPDLFLVAGSHHKVGQDANAKQHYQQLETYLKNNFPVSDIVYHWSAQHYQSADEIPYIGLASRLAKHTYMATGYFADGLVYGTLAGIILCDLILGKNNGFEKIYASNRLNLFSSLNFLIKEDSNVFAQYLKDIPQFTPLNIDEIKKGEGKIVDIDREKCGVYRDEKDQLHVVSAVCTHMKCIVNWNNAEKSWDCPCHGSRFTVDGKVIEGPAKINLERRGI